MHVCMCIRAQTSSGDEAQGEEGGDDILSRCRSHCLFPSHFCFGGEEHPLSGDKAARECL